MSFTSQFTNIRNDLKKDLRDTDLFNDSLHSICNEARKFETWPLESVIFDEYRYDADVREGLKTKNFY